tara:strand:- start:194 stop:517 length:324 start_codon:yes stop_codon:yes gene_type:complete
MKFSSSKMTAQISKLKESQNKSRLCVLMLEFYAYMEEQGYPEFWKNCKGILYPTRNIKDRRDRNLYWFFKWKDGTETRLLADEHNIQFQELKGFNLNKEAKNDSYKA